MTVDISLSADQEAVRSLFRTFLTNEAPPSVARAAEPLGFDPHLWAALGGIGAPGMGCPEEYGGGGASLTDLVVVAEEVGRAIAPVPLLDHLVVSRCTPLLDRAPDLTGGAFDGLVDGLVDGSTIGGVALAPADAAGVWRLVPAGAVAHVVVGVDGEDLVAVGSEPPGSGPLNHGCQPLADRSARDGRRVVLGPAGEFAVTLAEWQTLTAAALVGITERALEMGVAYAMERHQFGVPIGSFQSVQHGLADLPVLVDAGRMLTHEAAWAAQLDADAGGVIDLDDNTYTDHHTLAAMAFVFAGDAAALSTHRSLHYHGGYGFAEEYDIQLYYRRARGWRLVAGSPQDALLRLADLLLGPAGEI